MLDTRLKEYASELGFTSMSDFAYGEYNGYMLTLREGKGWKSATFAISFPDEATKNAVRSFLFDAEFQNEHIISEVNVTDASAELRFRDAVDTVDLMKKAIEMISLKLCETGVHGITHCGLCHAELGESEGEDVYVTGNVFRMHSDCIDGLGAAMTENAEQSKKSGSVVAGILGAAIGALVGVIPWALAFYFGWFMAFLGYVVGIASKKGYELFKGKDSKAKPIFVIICSLVAVVVAEIAVYLVGIMASYAAEEGIAITLSQAAYVFFLVLEYDTAILGSVAFDLVLSWVFVIIGMFPMIKAAFSKVGSATSTPIRLGGKTIS